MGLQPSSSSGSPYLIEDVPTSSGRVLLARAFQHYCLMHWGLSGEEIALAFEDGRLDGGAGRDSERVLGAVRLLGAVLARGAVRAWTRPKGGGEPVELVASAWELDDFAPRFATSAMDPAAPFDPDASPGHWIFVDSEGWDHLIEESVRDDVRRPQPRARGAADDGNDMSHDRTVATPASVDCLLRLPEVKRRTGLSRTTIYRKMEAGRFPESVPLSENMTSWRESEVAAWIAQPR